MRDPRSDHSGPFSGTLRPESDDNRVKILNVHYCQVLSYLSAFIFISTDLIISQMRSFVYYISEHLFCSICNLFFLQAYSVKCNTKFQNARVNSICLEFSLEYIFALLIATPIALYNVHAADCLPVQIGVTNEKTRQSETFNI